METAPEKPGEKALAPPRSERIKWWWGIYFVGVLCHPNAILLFFLFPLGLEDDYDLLVRRIADKMGTGPIPINAEFFWLLLGFAYGTFIIHFALTFYAKSRRTFRLLMFCLVLLVGSTVVGCHKIDEGIRLDPIQK